MKQPNTQGEVKFNLLVTLSNYSTRDVETFKTHMISDFCACGIPVIGKRMMLLTAAHHEARMRIGRDLTVTEISDIDGWAV